MSIIIGDCVEVMAAMEPESFDAIVTDPPYGLEFMGKAWDRNHDHRPWAEAAYRVAKPSAYLLAFGGTRTVHRMTVALEDAGWVIRDMLVWAYASGFPKSKASLKPAWEPIVMARKPGPLRKLNIDECRIGVEERAFTPKGIRPGAGNFIGDDWKPENAERSVEGRWPSNVLLTSPVFDGGWEGVVGGGRATTGGAIRTSRQGFAQDSYMGNGSGTGEFEGYGDSGTYSRFFIIPKASRSDREPDGAKGGDRVNKHPTVKPTALMRHLVRLVTPQGGVVLDPFLGSGTTALAAMDEGFEWTGIERDQEYAVMAQERIDALAARRRAEAARPVQEGLFDG